MTARTTALLGVLLLQGPSTGDPFAAALADYRAGRHAEALAGFRLAYDAAAQPHPAIATNLALAALRLSRPGDAEPVLRPLLALDDAAERALAEFLLGMAAMQRAEQAAAAAGLADAEPMAWQAAVDGARRALQHWLVAARRPGGWEESLRNAERAQRALAEWTRQRDAHRQKSQQEEAPPPEPPPGEPTAEERPPDLQVPPLSPQEVAELAKKLARKEQEKRATRAAAQRQRTAVGARDW